VKIENWPTAAVIVAGIVCTGGVVYFLVDAGWSSEAIIAFGTLAVGMFAGQAVNARKVSQVAAQTEAQTEKLDTIVEQTNGMSTAQIEQVAETAAARAIVKYEHRNNPNPAAGATLPNRPVWPPGRWG
jgi:hypothetical protein